MFNVSLFLKFYFILMLLARFYVVFYLKIRIVLCFLFFEVDKIMIIEDEV